MKTGNRYAAKAISKKWIIAENSRLDMVKNEIETSRKLSGNRNFARLIEVQETGNTIYLIYELLGGPHLIPEQPVTTDNAFFMCLAKILLKAVLFMKKNSIVHRDLKPGNILYKNNSTSFEKNDLKIIDFGFAVDTKKINQYQNHSLRCGTPGFIAPEVFKIDQKNFKSNIQTKIDIFSLGVIFHLLVYGVYPYGEGEVSEVLERNIYDVRVEVDEIEGQILVEKDGVVPDLIFGMLEKDPNRRFTVEECLAHPFFQAF